MVHLGSNVNGTALQALKKKQRVEWAKAKSIQRRKRKKPKRKGTVGGLCCQCPGCEWHTGVCAWQSALAGALDHDHIVPRFVGGTGIASNMRWLCPNCHRLKSLLESLPGSGVGYR